MGRFFFATDKLTIGDEADEKRHALCGEYMSCGVFRNLGYRDARPGGWFSYELAVRPGFLSALRATYFGGDAGRHFRVYANGVLIGREEIPPDAPPEFFIREYPLPRELTEQGGKLTIKFVTEGDSYAGGVFGTLAIVNPGRAALSARGLSWVAAAALFAALTAAVVAAAATLSGREK